MINWPSSDDGNRGEEGEDGGELIFVVFFV
mgnify:CR=1 FL=1